MTTINQNLCHFNVDPPQALADQDLGVLKTPFHGVKVVTGNIKREVTKGAQAAGKFFHLGGTLETKILPHIRAFFHREKTGPVVKFYYGNGHSAQLKQILSQLHNFNLIEDTPLTSAELAKAWQLINVYIHRREKAIIAKDSFALLHCDSQMNRLHQLLDKTQIKKMLRSEFEVEDWELLDEIDFELLKEHLECLNKLFSLKVFRDLHFQEEMKKIFGVNFKEALLSEALAKVLAYIGGLDGKTIQLPVKDTKSESGYKLADFQIKEIILGDALPAYILESKADDQNPWLVIRGTQVFTKRAKDGRECRTGSFESILADTIDPRGLAKNVIVKSMVHRPLVQVKGKWVQKESLNDIFQTWIKQHKQVNIAGHSLGGYLANDIAVRYFDTVKTAYGFNSPAMGEELTQLWTKKVQQHNSKTVLQTAEDINLKIINFHNEGDIVPTGGYAMIGKNIAIDTRNPKRVWHDHIRHSLTRNFKAQLINVEKENNKISRLILEITRVGVGYIMYGVLRAFNKHSIPDWWKNRKLYAKALKQQKFV